MICFPDYSAHKRLKGVGAKLRFVQLEQTERGRINRNKESGGLKNGGRNGSGCA